MLKFPNKKIRSAAILKYMQDAGISGAVCFSCGNASRELKKAGADVFDVSPFGCMRPNKWFTPAEIKKIWPDLFDATSGHLPLFLMIEISKLYKSFLGELENLEYNVPTGSGETIFCLRMAYPKIKFKPVYNLDSATRYNSEAPLNYLVESLF